MNILMIGNGFDLAHGLPTQYRDFLHLGQKVANA
ncbi:MAG: bacteriophage abortive infection AbiH family protein [Lachnospiraceae bacterium]|nr:bacteriophage abortive infection AbiH family protein [Lachnospiraceae bacterium]MDE6185271.1 bacteriophage abortive infection AbiH family protein [Lachnospiraceae bacterium]